MELQNSVFPNLFYTILDIQLLISDTFVFQIEEHCNQSELMFSGHFSSFSSFMPILILVGKGVRLFCALSGLTMSLPYRITDKTSLNYS